LLLLTISQPLCTILPSNRVQPNSIQRRFEPTCSSSPSTPQTHTIVHILHPPANALSFLDKHSPNRNTRIHSPSNLTLAARHHTQTIHRSAYTPRFSLSNGEINCTARIFGAPVTVRRNTERNASSVIYPHVGCRNSDVRCCTCEKRSTRMRRSTHRPRIADAVDVVAGEIDQHNVSARSFTEFGVSRPGRRLLRACCAAMVPAIAWFTMRGREPFEVSTEDALMRHPERRERRSRSMRC